MAGDSTRFSSILCNLHLQFKNEIIMLQICVYCASSDKIDSKYFDAADQLAAVIIEAGATTIYGGGARGLMGRLADQIIEQGGTIIGVIPEFMKAVEWDHPKATEMRVVPDMHTRKRAFLEGTGAIVALPGGCCGLQFLDSQWHQPQFQLFAGDGLIEDFGWQVRRSRRVRSRILRCRWAHR